MLGSQPPHSADDLPCAPLHTPKSVAVATTEMMWAIALATTRASIASTTRGLALWSRLMRAPIGPWSLIVSPLGCSSRHSHDPSAVSASAAAPSGASAEATARAAPADAAGEETAAFASYRSSGGHAAAQVITHH
jgi:hypothetical protein